MNKAELKEIYVQLCNLLNDFENSPDDFEDDGCLSDGEWLDVFYEHCIKLKNNIEIALDDKI